MPVNIKIETNLRVNMQVWSGFTLNMLVSLKIVVNLCAIMQIKSKISTKMRSIN